MTRTAVRSKAKPLPRFANRQEEAEFWDTHDVFDYVDEAAEPIRLEVTGPLSEPVTLHIDIETMEEVRALAEAQGVPPDGLLYLWIIERRDAERQRRVDGDDGAPLS